MDVAIDDACLVDLEVTCSSGAQEPSNEIQGFVTSLAKNEAPSGVALIEVADGAMEFSPQNLANVEQISATVMLPKDVLFGAAVEQAPSAV